MIVYKKPDEIAVVFEIKDFESTNEKLKKNLLRIVQMSENINITLDLQKIQDLSVSTFSLFASFLYSLKNKDNEIKILAEQEIMNGLKQIGIGKLLKSMEVNDNGIGS
ncbi:MAG: hypothetical protein KDK90_04575 [Leptospiraceae bacterium]|nr:hypothetical protein [Leptospiraceae bacterium]